MKKKNSPPSMTTVLLMVILAVSLLTFLFSGLSFLHENNWLATLVPPAPPAPPAITSTPTWSTVNGVATLSFLVTGRVAGQTMFTVSVNGTPVTVTYAGWTGTRGSATNGRVTLTLNNASLRSALNGQTVSRATTIVTIARTPAPTPTPSTGQTTSPSTGTGGTIAPSRPSGP